MSGTLLEVDNISTAFMFMRELFMLCRMFLFPLVPVRLSGWSEKVAVAKA